MGTLLTALPSGSLRYGKGALVLAPDRDQQYIQGVHMLDAS